METKISCNLCSVLLTVENKAKRTQRCVQCYRNGENERRKLYRLNNRQKTLEQNRLYKSRYNERYPDKVKNVKQHQKEQYICGCGEVICNSSTTQHEKSRRHTIHNELITWSNPKGVDYNQKQKEFDDVCEERRKKIEFDKSQIY